MKMTLAGGATALALLLPGAALADCAAALAGLRDEVNAAEQQALEPLAAEPMVVRLSDGTLRDLRAEPDVADPIESWFTDAGESDASVADPARAYRERLTAAEAALAADGSGADGAPTCEEAVETLREMRRG